MSQKLRRTSTGTLWIFVVEQAKQPEEAFVLCRQGVRLHPADKEQAIRDTKDSHLQYPVAGFAFAHVSELQLYEGVKRRRLHAS